VFPLRDDNPTRSFPIVTLALILINSGVFLAQLVLGDRFTMVFAMRPALVSHVPFETDPRTGLPIWVTVFTSMFLHGSWMHLIGNMLFLWIFGNNTEDTLGKFRFLLFYFVCGLAAAGLHTVLGWNSPVPTLGASGAIAGVLGAYIYLFPHARITTVILIPFLWTVVDLSAQVVLGFWFVMQLFNMLGTTAATLGGRPDAGGVAFGAHVGGFIAGWLLIRVMAPPREPRPRYTTRPRYFDDNWS